MKTPGKLGFLRYLILGLAAWIAAVLTACAKSGSSGPSNPPPPPCIGNNCGGILPFDQKVGFYAQTSNLDYYYANGGSSYTTQSDFYNVLRYSMGVCDREQTNIGLANCQNWMSGYHDIVLLMDNATASQAKLILRSYPSYNPNAWYYVSLPSLGQFFGSLFGISGGNPAAIYNPMVLNMTVNPINENKGFVLRGYGPQWSGSWNVLMQFVVPEGKVENPAIDFMFVWNNMDAATTFDSSRAASLGRMVRCNLADCGLGYIP